jgi:hypothetical protein
MIHAAEETQPRNKDIKDNEEWEDEVAAKQQVKNKARMEKIDDLASMGKEEVDPMQTQAKRLSDFIEIIIKVGK